MTITHNTAITGTNSTAYQISKDPWNEAHAVADSTITEAMLGLTDVATANATTAVHGLLQKFPNDTTQFLDGAGAFDTVKDSDLSLSDITTGNASTSAHGLLKKLPNDVTLFLDGTGAYSAPAASVNIKQTEQDFGATAVSEATFTIVDADVSASSQIIAALAYVAPTGKAIEEVYMEQPMKIACAPGTGQFDMLVQTEGDVSDKFVFVYLVG